MLRNRIAIQALLLRLFMPALLAVTLLLAILVYNSLHATIIDRFDRKLATTSSLTGVLVTPRDHDLLIAAAGSGHAAELERSVPYLRNVVPMRRIRTALGLTYLYTQTLGPAQGVTYILDSSPGKDHSPIGSTDTLPDETMAGLRRIRAAGGIYVSPIQFQQQWGLLKTSAAPVYGADGHRTASAGADVNISIINVATQNALFASAVIGIGSILACILVVLAIVRRVGRPIESLRQEALRIAAGDYTPPAPIAGPREVKRLGKSLAELAGQLSAAVAARRAQAARHEREADEAALADAAAAGKACPAVLLVGGAAEEIWWVAANETSIAARLAGRAMAQLASQIAAEPALTGHWRRLADLQHGSCLRLDRSGPAMEVIGRGGIDLIVDGEHVSLTVDAPRTGLAWGHVSLLTGGREVALVGEAAS